jgi:hypothetical protein
MASVNQSKNDPHHSDADQRHQDRTWKMCESPLARGVAR